MNSIPIANMKLQTLALSLFLFNSCNTSSISDEGVSEESLTLNTLVAAEATADVVKELPDFTQFTDVKEKKEAFFDFLRPMVEDENNRITKERAIIKALYATYDEKGSLAEADEAWLMAKATKMRIKDFDIADAEDRTTLLRKVDVIPPSLFLAQAANESSWGTSRFAVEANNLFGQWCFDEGCGIVPLKRGAHETYQIRKFETVNAAVNSYVNNINSHNAYKELRMVRIEMRNNEELLTGEALAVGLEKYSARGEAYVKEIQSMIRVNKLDVAQ